MSLMCTSLYKPAGAREDEDRAPQLSPTERSFVQGTFPQSSYSRYRIQPPTRVCQTTAMWAGRRTCEPEDNAQFELKSSDATAAPHLAFAVGTLLRIGDCQKPANEVEDREEKDVGLDISGPSDRVKLRVYCQSGDCVSWVYLSNGYVLVVMRT